MAEGRGTIFPGSLTIARPIDTLVVDSVTKALMRSLSSSAASYAVACSPIPDGYSITFGTGADIVFTVDGTNVIVEQGAGAGLFLEEAAAVRIVDTTDNTKRQAYDVSGVTTATTRTYTVPDFNYAPGVSVVPAAAADPGTGAAIPVTGSVSIPLTIGTGAETNTLAIPTAIGQRLSLVASVAGGGTRTITASQTINQTGNTKMAFTQLADWIVLEGVSIAGALRWRVASNDGVTLS